MTRLSRETRTAHGRDSIAGTTRVRHATAPLENRTDLWLLDWSRILVAARFFVGQPFPGSNRVAPLPKQHAVSCVFGRSPPCESSGEFAAWARLRVGLAVARLGTVVASAAAEYPLYTLCPSGTEQYPEDWWRGACEVLSRVAAQVDGEIVGLGLTGQMKGAVFLDAAGRVIRPTLLWNDQAH
jgi:hypothetical protein